MAELIEGMGGIVNIILFVLYLVIGFPIISTAIRNICHGEIFDENFLMVVASVASICIGEVKEALMVVLLYRIGEYLQGKAVDNSRRSITNLIDIRPDYANRIKGLDLIKVDPKELNIGEIIAVLPGERIPVDGVVTEGFSRIDTSAITGESMPEDAEKGSKVCSGCINLDGLIKVKVSKKSSESTAARILELVENSALSRAKTESFITKFARIYTPSVCALALLVAIVPGLITKDWATWIEKAVIMLVVSCPCALVISIPLGFFGGIGGASKKGILIKGGNYLESLSKSDVILFDKTGTLTKGVFSVVAIHPEEIKESELLKLAAYAESFSNHPIARSLAEEYGKHIDKARVKDVKESLGLGITANVDGKIVSCGNIKYMESLGIKARDCKLTGTVVHVAIENVYSGHIVISDIVKEDSQDALKALKDLGVLETVMLTGDKKNIAQDVSSKLPSLSKYYAECLPEDKLRITNEYIQSGRKIAFVGDGINDAPSLMKATVGIAMGGMGTAAAVEAADIVLMNDKPSDVALAVKIARKTLRIVKENIYLSIGVKVAVIIIAALGFTSVWLAEFADVGVCLLAILNSMRTLKIK